jgi:DNA-binding GntR family transcriptional regulator
MVKKLMNPERRSSGPRLSSLAAEGTVTESVHGQLRQAVLRGQLKPGQYLVELDVARQYGVSRGPAREALRLLQQEGFLDVIPRRGYIVAPITVTKVRELFDLRMILEVAAAARATRNATPQEVDHLERLVGDPYSPGDPESYSRFLAQNKAFHSAVCRLARNTRVSRIVESLLDELERLFHLGLDVRDRSELLVQEHRDLVAAMRLGIPEDAARVMESQIESACQMVLEGIMRGALPGTVT